MSYYAFAKLNADDLNAVQALERRLGSPLVAMQPVDLAPAPIGDDALEAVKDLELRLGITLVAVNH